MYTIEERFTNGLTACFFISFLLLDESVEHIKKNIANKIACLEPVVEET